MKTSILVPLVLMSLSAFAGEPRNENRSRVASEQIAEVGACSDVQVNERIVDVLRRNQDGTLKTNKNGEFLSEPAVEVSASASIFVKMNQNIENYVVKVTPGFLWMNDEEMIPNSSSFATKQVVSRQDFAEKEHIAIRVLKEQGGYYSGYDNSLVDALKAGVKAKVRAQCESYRAAASKQIAQ